MRARKRRWKSLGGRKSIKCVTSWRVILRRRMRAPKETEKRMRWDYEEKGFQA